LEPSHYGEDATRILDDDPRASTDHGLGLGLGEERLLLESIRRHPSSRRRV
jgi:hypothetical protein